MVCRGDFDRLRTEVSVGFVSHLSDNSLKATDRRAVPHKHVHQSRKSRGKGDEPDIRVRGRGETQARRANVQGMGYPGVLLEHASQSYSSSSSSPMCLPPVLRSLILFCLDIAAHSNLSATCYPCQRNAASYRNARCDPLTRRCQAIFYHTWRSFQQGWHNPR
jgi:hypothetical protein